MKTSFAVAVLSLVWSTASFSQERRLEAGGQVVVTDLDELQESDFGFGGRFGFRPASLFALEGELSYFPSEIPEDLPVTESRLEALFGARIGPRFERFAIFGKVRPGFLRFAEAPEPVACIAIFPPPLSCLLAEGRTVLAFDLGGGVELFPTESSILRFDVSDLLLRYPGPVFNRDREAFPEGGFWSHNLRLSFGAGWRF